MGEDLKFTTAGEYMEQYRSTTLEERYDSYVALCGPHETVPDFEQWLNTVT